MPPPETMRAMSRAERGEAVEASSFPGDNYPMRNCRDHKLAKLHFASSGFFFVSEESAAVLSSFDMGNSRLYPTRIWYPDRKTPVPGNYFYLNIANLKDAFLPGSSREFEPYNNAWAARLVSLGNDKTVLGRKALEGPDIWIDKNVWHSFFLSDALVKGLKKAGILGDWGVYRCIIDEGIRDSGDLRGLFLRKSRA